MKDRFGDVYTAFRRLFTNHAAQTVEVPTRNRRGNGDARAREKLSEQSSSDFQRASRHSGEVYAVASWSELQHSAGNRTFLRLLGMSAVQAKRKMSLPV